jgi:hypothetical protein
VSPAKAASGTLLCWRSLHNHCAVSACACERQHIKSSTHGVVHRMSGNCAASGCNKPLAPLAAASVMLPVLWEAGSHYLQSC